MKTTLHDTVNSRFYAPLETALAAAKSSRNCPEFPDSEFLETGVGRVIDDAFTGRAWVQKLQQMVSMRLSVSNFFKTLGSQRRLDMLGEVAEYVRLQSTYSAARCFDASPTAIRPTASSTYS